MTLYKVFVDVSGSLYFNAKNEQEALDKAESFLSQATDEAVEVVIGNGSVASLPGEVFEVVVDAHVQG